MSRPPVHIIVLTFRMRETARACLESLRSLTYSNLEIIVVDNDSGDGTEEMVRGEFPETIVIQTGANLGYTGGNNAGIEYAMNQGAEYVLILNPDTIIENPGFIEEMVAYLETHRDVGIAGPRVFLREKGEIQNTVLFAPGLWRNIVNWVRFRIDPGSLEFSGDQVVDSHVLNGVCIMIRADCLRQTGLFDENIFMYIEDADLDYRARCLGWKVRYLPIDSVIHAQKRDGYEMTGMVSFLLRRNSVYFLCKIGRRFEAWGYAILSIAVLAGRAALRRGAFREYMAFCGKLIRAYRRILLGMSFDRDFGPPYTEV
ncbi:MAG: glycosyltransferase family 2 protein [Acidobacteriota bacterium]|nr:MAG: glycosyltransferase family 2 protein [Acidobacteriota bacterium]